MTTKKRGLGRGLDALLANSRQSVAVTPTAAAATTTASTSNDMTSAKPIKTSGLENGELRHLPVEWIQPGRYQPRRDIQPEALEELAASIKSQGLMQPIVVRPLPDQSDRYEIIAGERRWRACQLAGFEQLPVLIKYVADEAAIAMALIENIQREDLNPMEEALALHRLQHEFELTQLEVAEAVGKGRATVANLLRLIKLNDDVKKLLEHGDIELGHAKALLSLEGNDQSQAAQQVVSRAMTVRQTETLVRNWHSKKAKTKQSSVDPDVLKLERVLGDRLGTRVAIQHTAKGKGKLVIDYSNLDELDGILSHIK